MWENLKSVFLEPDALIYRKVIPLANPNMIRFTFDVRLERMDLIEFDFYRRCRLDKS